MRRITLLGSVLGFAIPLLTAVSAQAQTRSWVSGVGDDLNPCSRTAPCKTFAGAISKTSTGGEINCLDPNGAGAVTITKSISIVCDYTEGGVLASGINGIIVNAPAGSIVTLKGLDIECFGTGLNGIEMINVGVTLHIHKVQVRNCRASGGNGNGILVAPSSGVGVVMVADSYITNNGGTISNAGILIRPTGGANAKVSVNGVKLEANTNGIFMDGAGGGGASNLAVKDSVLSANSNAGIAVASTGSGFVATIANSLITLNSGNGVGVAGASATARIGGNTISNNGTGVANTGTLQSFKNNQIAGNGADGTPITAVNSGGLILN
jgi:hypothetical protein